MLALALAPAGCFCGCNYVCICVCIGCVQVCICLQVSIAFALVLRLCLHLHCTYVCIGVAMLLALQWCCTWVAPVSVCFVPSKFRKETLKNLHLLWHLLAVVCADAIDLVSACGFIAWNRIATSCIALNVVQMHLLTLQLHLHCSHSMISETLAVCLRVCKCFAPAFVYEIWLE